MKRNKEKRRPKEKDFTMIDREREEESVPFRWWKFQVPRNIDHIDSRGHFREFFFGQSVEKVQEKESRSSRELSFFLFFCKLDSVIDF